MLLLFLFVFSFLRCKKRITHFPEVAFASLRLVGLCPPSNPYSDDNGGAIFRTPPSGSAIFVFKLQLPALRIILNNIVRSHFRKQVFSMTPGNIIFNNVCQRCQDSFCGGCLRFAQARRASPSVESLQRRQRRSHIPQPAGRVCHFFCLIDGL